MPPKDRHGACLGPLQPALHSQHARARAHPTVAATAQLRPCSSPCTCLPGQDQGVSPVHPPVHSAAPCPSTLSFLAVPAWCLGTVEDSWSPVTSLGSTPGAPSCTRCVLSPLPSLSGLSAALALLQRGRGRARPWQLLHRVLGGAFINGGEHELTTPARTTVTFGRHAETGGHSD